MLVPRVPQCHIYVIRSAQLLKRCLKVYKISWKNVYQFPVKTCYGNLGSTPGSKRREILANRAKTPQPGLDRRRLSVDYIGTNSSTGHPSRRLSKGSNPRSPRSRPLSRESYASFESSWNGSSTSLYSDSE